MARSPILGKRGELRGPPKATELVDTRGLERLTGLNALSVLDRVGAVATPSLSAMLFVRLGLQSVEFEGMKR